MRSSNAIRQDRAISCITAVRVLVGQEQRQMSCSSQALIGSNESGLGPVGDRISDETRAECSKSSIRNSAEDAHDAQARNTRLLGVRTLLGSVSLANESAISTDKVSTSSHELCVTLRKHSETFSKRTSAQLSINGSVTMNDSTRIRVAS